MKVIKFSEENQYRYRYFRNGTYSVLEQNPINKVMITAELIKTFTHITTSVVDPDPDPVGSETFGRIRIRIWIRKK